ncbi:MAG TPA: 3,4-dehydroadipyl-CoA semialdehyde dehydrogenase [Steroidobacter sp.]|jgi:3,4-dehydroadipyl-CoA semialdehyde dehydrogenase|nr:3,4-dehydroadipyl-CoA semialdehyde dehydrogenase [Steroidobacter sp.]
MQVQSFVDGRWVTGADDGQALVDPVTGQEIARASSAGIDFAAALAHGRRVGGASLRAMTYAERAALLNQIADVLAAHKAEYYRLSLQNSGATEADAAFDVDGAIFTLKYYSRAGAALGAARHLLEGSVAALSKDGSFSAAHVGVPLRGVAVHVNAFNFPSWGLWEKAAAALLSGVPVLAKPATATCLLAERMVRDVVTAGVLPAGALQIVCGGAGDLLDHLTADDALAFTGSAATAERIRANPAVLKNSVRVNVEADSVNAALLGPDAAPGTPEFEAFAKETAREMTLKAGQKCTAIRRALVPAQWLDAAGEAIAARLGSTVVGNPRNSDVRMGPLVNEAQRRAALDRLAALRTETDVLCGGGLPGTVVDANASAGAFVAPTLLRCGDPHAGRAVHEVEVFGPVATLLPFQDWDDALALAARGGGSLVASVYTADADAHARAALELATTHGRVLAVDASVAKTQTGHGNVVPSCLHGGPGRAGGGEELGGLRALWFYHRRSALQGPTARVTALAGAGAFPQL